MVKHARILRYDHVRERSRGKGRGASQARARGGDGDEQQCNVSLSLLCSVWEPCDCAAFSELYEDEIVELVSLEGQYDLTSWPLMLGRIEKIDADEAMQGMLKQQSTAAWTPTNFIWETESGLPLVFWRFSIAL